MKNRKSATRRQVINWTDHLRTAREDKDSILLPINTTWGNPRHGSIISVENRQPICATDPTVDRVSIYLEVYSYNDNLLRNTERLKVLTLGLLGGGGVGTAPQPWRFSPITFLMIPTGKIASVYQVTRDRRHILAYVTFILTLSRDICHDVNSP